MKKLLNKQVQDCKLEKVNSFIRCLYKSQRTRNSLLEQDFLNEKMNKLIPPITAIVITIFFLICILLLFMGFLVLK